VVSMLPGWSLSPISNIPAKLEADREHQGRVIRGIAEQDWCCVPRDRGQGPRNIGR
jgi:hypothetical protein